MAHVKKSKSAAAAAQAQAAGPAPEALPEPEAQGGQDEGVDASLCAGCGEPLAWHDAPCAAAAPAAPVSARPAAGSFAFDLGQPVQPASLPRPYQVIWRGQVKERHPQTGWVHRVNVYRLNDGYWDCYHEEELQPT